MVFNAPQPVPGLPQAHLLDCEEKDSHNYAQPCSNRRNCRLGFADRTLSPDAVPRDFDHTPCAGQHPLAVHDVCRYCVASTEDEHWFKLANTYFSEIPPPQAESNRSRHYLTRLCRLCEVREETLLAHIQNNAPAIQVMNLPTPAQRLLMSDWPQNRCTCERTSLYAGVRCGLHRRSKWNLERPILVAQKKRKKNFLINIEQDAQLQRIPSTQATRMRRQTNGLWRACRCGADPVATTDVAVVMQCMGCAGIVHFPPPPAGATQPAVINPNSVLLNQNSMTTPGLFALP
jgi:hypothetical protein